MFLQRAESRRVLVWYLPISSGLWQVGCRLAPYYARGDEWLTLCLCLSGRCSGERALAMHRNSAQLTLPCPVLLPGWLQWYRPTELEPFEGNTGEAFPRLLLPQGC